MSNEQEQEHCVGRDGLDCGLQGGRAGEPADEAGLRRARGDDGRRAAVHHRGAFKTLSRHPVVTDLYDEEEGWKPTHIKLADEADLLLIAPATANTIAKLALGLANDALSCVALALNPKAKVLVAPAMNGKMWLHPATQQNVAALKARGVEFIGPEEGLLSCGYEGLGRLWPVEKVAERALELLA